MPGSSWTRRLGARRRARRRRAEQADQRVEELRLAHRLGEVGREQACSASPASRPAERAEEHERQRRRRAARIVARQRERRPSPACACRGSRASNGSPAPSQRSASRRRCRWRATACPTWPPAGRATRRLVALSSTTSTRLPCSAGCAPTKSRWRAGGSSAHAGASMVNWNVEPVPGRRSRAHMRPPISSARRLLIARPRPVPPYLRVVEESACVNDWNSRPMRLRRDADAGVAHRERRAATAVGRAAALAVTVQHDLALLGELHRVGEQVEQHLAQARDVAADGRRHVAVEHVRRCRGSSRGRARSTRSSADSTQSRRSKGCDSMSSRPASIFEKSRMSLMMREQRVAGVADGARDSRAARRRASVSSSRPLMPITPFIGVRISWLIVARNELLAALAASAAARASCASREETRVLDGDHRLVGERLERRPAPCR